MDEKIKVTDKRMFTADGEVRPQASDQADHVADPKPDPIEESPRSEAVESREEPSGNSERGQSASPQGELPEPTFIDLVGLLAQPIALFLGDAAMPGGETEENLPLARFHIDLLEVVRSKTEGNLSAEEAKLLEDLLYQLRMRYLEKAG